MTFAHQDFKQRAISINLTKGYDYPKGFDKMMQELKCALNEDGHKSTYARVRFWKLHDGAAVSPFPMGFRPFFP